MLLNISVLAKGSSFGVQVVGSYSQTLTSGQYESYSAFYVFRKLPVNVVGKPRRILRRSPPQHVSRDERERLVNMATKLIVATVRFQITV